MTNNLKHNSYCLQTPCKQKKTNKFVMPKAYPPYLDAAIKNDCMSSLEKARFVRYMASHFYAQEPNPKPTQYCTMAQQCIEICPSLADTAELNHKVLNKIDNSELLLVG